MAILKPYKKNSDPDLNLDMNVSLINISTKDHDWIQMCILFGSFRWIQSKNHDFL